MDRLTFRCSACGSDEFNIPADPQPNDTATCNGCGATTTVGDLKAAALQQSEEHAKRIAENAFKNRR